MKTVLNWTQNMEFNATAAGHTIAMDAKSPIGSDKHMTPKEMVLAGLGGCTAMDVVALMKKHKQTYTAFEVEVDANLTTGGMPKVFTDAVIVFKMQGSVDPEILKNSVTLSQTKYCGVSAMLAKAFPIKYEIHLNNEKIFEGQSHFEG